MIDRQVDFSQSGKVWILLGAFVVTLYILWQLSSSIAAGSWKFALLIAVAFAAFFIVAQIARDWRSGVYYFLFWLLIEDFVRKQMGNNMTVYFAKDVLVAITYASFVISRMRERGKPFHPPFRFAMGAFFVLGLIQVFNPHSPSIFYGLLGLKLYFYYIPLMFVGYALFQEERDIPRFCSFNMIMGGMIATVGLIQSVYSINFLNPKGMEDIDELSHMTRYTHEGAALVRAPSIFVSEGRFGSYMFIAFVIGIGGAAYLLLRSTRRGRMTVFSGLGLVVLGGLMTGSRGAVVYLSATALLLSAGFIWGAPLGKSAGYRLVKAIRRGFSFIAVAVVLAVVIIPQAVVPRFTFYEETLLPNSKYYEAGFRSWDYPLQELEKAFSDPNWVTGNGIGTLSLGAQYVTRVMDVPRLGIGVENGFGALILELGILGPILWILWGISMLVAALKVTLQLKGTWAFPLALPTVWFTFCLFFPLTWGGLVQYQNFVTNAYFWLFMGILFRLPDLVKKSEADDPMLAARKTANPII